MAKRLPGGIKAFATLYNLNAGYILSIGRLKVQILTQLNIARGLSSKD